MQYQEDDVAEARFSYDISPMAVVVSKKNRRYVLLRNACLVLRYRQMV
jgi:hypothetical protein